ncbi:MAG: ornithine cyclodeaminase family protein [Janthinobacterium lividum]
MPVTLLHDDDVLSLLNMHELIPLLEEFLLETQRGSAVTPSRHAVSFEPYGRLVFTIGGGHTGSRPVAGFRVYSTFPTSDGADDDQVVAAWDSERGTLLGLIVGSSLGEWRTGALGGVAVKAMSRPDAQSCAVLGTGRQARTQLLATAACRTLREIRVYGRDPERRHGFAAALTDMIGVRVWPSETAQEAVEGADIVLCATSSPTPVLETAWLKEGAHVNSVGPKTLTKHELPFDLADRVTLLATDSIEQVNSYPEPYFLSRSAVWSELRELATLLPSTTDGAEWRRDGVSLFCSAGLAGTEIVAAVHVLQRHRDRRT